MLIFCKSDWQTDCCQIKDPSGWGYWSWQSPIIYSFLLQLLIIYVAATEGKPATKENWWTHHADMTHMKLQIALLYMCCKEEWSMGTCKLLIHGNPAEATPNLSTPVLRWDLLMYSEYFLHLTFTLTQWLNDSATTESKLLVYITTGP